jgi:hypothetical protein
VRGALRQAIPPAAAPTDAPATAMCGRASAGGTAAAPAAVAAVTSSRSSPTSPSTTLGAPRMRRACDTLPPPSASTSSMWDLFDRGMERPSLDSVMKLLTCESIALLRSVAGEENPRRRLEQSQEEGVPAAAVDPSSPTATSLLLSLSLPSVSSASASSPVTFGSSAAAVDPAVAAVVPLLSGCMWPTAFRVQESKYLCHTHHSASDVSCYLCKIMLVTTMFSVRCVTALPCL